MFPHAHTVYFKPYLGTGVVQVEDVLFRVDIEGLMSISPVVRDLVDGASVRTARGRERFNNARPLRIERPGLSADLFEKFLKYFNSPRAWTISRREVYAACIALGADLSTNPTPALF